MARYYFHFNDGKRTFIDSFGVDLVGIASARSRAATQVREMRDVIAQQNIQDWSKWKMVVVDDYGKSVYEIGFDLKPIGYL